MNGPNLWLAGKSEKGEQQAVFLRRQRILVGCRIAPMKRPLRMEKTIAALLGSPGTTDPLLRTAVFEHARLGAGEVPESLKSFMQKIMERPWSINNEDFAQLGKAGYTEDQIYELLVAAATGAGVRRFDAAVRAIEGAR